MFITVEFVGVLRTLAKMRKCTVELEEEMTVSALMRKLKAELFSDKEFVDESNLLIVMNGKEISILKGLQTLLKEKDIVKIIPASHGG